MWHLVLTELRSHSHEMLHGPIINKLVLHTIRASYYVHCIFWMHHVDKHIATFSALQHNNHFINPDTSFLFKGNLLTVQLDEVTMSRHWRLPYWLVSYKCRVHKSTHPTNHWGRRWVGAKQATNHYPNKYWPNFVNGYMLQITVKMLC